MYTAFVVATTLLVVGLLGLSAGSSDNNDDLKTYGGCLVVAAVAVAFALLFLLWGVQIGRP